MSNPGSRRALVIAAEKTATELASALSVHADLEVRVLTQFEPLGDLLSVPDVILLERELPDVDGLKVLERLRQLPGGAHVPVVVIAHAWDADSLARAARLRANSCLRWPDEGANRAAWLQEIGRFWVAINEPAN